MSRVASRFLVVALATLLATGWLTARPTAVMAAGSGSVSLTALGAAAEEEFDSLASSGTANTTLPVGWFLIESGSSSANNDAYAAGTGSGNAGDVYSFGAAGDPERAFGTLLSGTLTPTIGAAFTNNTGSQITALDFGYTGEQWRLGALGSAGTPPRGPDRLDFQYSLDATSVVTGTWTDVNGLDFTSPITGPDTGLLDGNLPANRTAIAGTVAGLAITVGATFWVRWSDFNVGSSDDGLAVDEFSVTPSGDGPGQITLSINNVSQAESDSGSVGFQFTVSLSEPAGAGGVTFDLATEDGTAESTANEDYSATTLAGETIRAGESSTTFSIPVTGDMVFEPDETFFVNISNVSGAVIGDGQGLGTIENDDAASCEDAFTPIYSIQGSGQSAEITGTVTTQGIVVGDFEGPLLTGLQGFYLQDATGDDDDATSDGIFVFTGNADNALNAGDLVQVTGYARERFDQTTLNGSNSNTAAVPAANIVDCGATGSITAVDVEMPFASTTYPERFEGMLVNFPQPLVISEYFNYDRFGEIVLALPLDGEDRLFTPTNIVEPGAPAIERAAEYSLRRITLDDRLGVGNPDFTRHPNGAGFSLDNRFRGGDTVANAVGVLAFDFGAYKIEPTAPADYTEVNSRTAAPEAVGGSLKVASMNMLNFFLTLDTTSNDSGPGPCGGNANLDCRGADANQPTEFTRQRDKLLAALAGLNADVIGLNEIENTPDVDPLGDPTRGIVPGLNAMPGVGPYDRIDTGVIGTDAIRVGFVYRSDVVTPVGSFEVLTSSVDPRFDDTRSRPALAQTFEEIATGERFTVVVNHLKSKGSACAGDPDTGDGQGNCNATRTLAAQALVDWLATDPTGSGDPDLMIIGDLNAYAKEDPIDAVKAGADDTTGTEDDYTNLIKRYQGPYAYSYVFDGQAGYLDHALGNAPMTGQVTGAADWHIDADEPDLIDYDTSFKSDAQDAIYAPDAYRASDHDPLVLGLDLNAPPTFEIVAGISCSTSANGGSFLVTVDDLQTAPGALSLTLAGNTNPTLVPNGNVSTGSGANRTVAITAAKGKSGSAVLTFSLSDGVNTVTFDINVQIGSGLDDTLTGTGGSDLLVGAQGSDDLAGLGGVDVLCGGNGADALAGGDGADLLDGGKGEDSLSGDAGDDTLRGGQGADTLTGGTGADEFSGGQGGDTNTDFTPADGDTSDGT